MHKLGVEEWLVSAVVSMYTGAKTVVRTVHGNSSGFEVKVGTYQSSALSPLLFMVALCNRADHYIFALWFLSFYFLSSFFPRLISAVRYWMSTTHGVALV